MRLQKRVYVYMGIEAPADGMCPWAADRVHTFISTCKLNSLNMLIEFGHSHSRSDEQDHLAVVFSN